MTGCSGRGCDDLLIVPLLLGGKRFLFCCFGGGGAWVGGGAALVLGPEDVPLVDVVDTMIELAMRGRRCWPVFLVRENSASLITGFGSVVGSD